MKFTLHKFAQIGLPRLGLASPILGILAFVSVVWATTRVSDAVQSISHRKALKDAQTSVSIVREAATNSQIMSSAKRLLVIAPAVDILVQGNSMTISIGDRASFAEWLNAMTAVQSTLPGYQWDVTEICLAVCEGGRAARAVIKANKPTIHIEKIKD